MELSLLDQYSPQAIIFDCDGTLVDTMPAHYKAWETIFARYEMSVPLSSLDLFPSCPSWMVVEKLSQDLGRALDAKAIGEEKELVYFDSLESAPLIDHVVPYVYHFHQRIPLAVLSGGGRKGVLKSLNFHGLVPYFDQIVAADDSFPPKTTPAVFQQLAALLGAEAERCVVFEDGDIGIASSLAAGMMAVDVRRQPMTVQLPS